MAIQTIFTHSTATGKLLSPPSIRSYIFQWMPRRTWKRCVLNTCFKVSSRRFRYALLFLLVFPVFFGLKGRKSETIIDPCAQQNHVAAEPLYHNRTRRKLVVEVSHGLGNRLRALSSAAALARVSNRQLHVVWIQDIHLNASIYDLFHVSENQFIERSYLQCALSVPQYVVYDYLKDPVDQNRRPKVQTHTRKHIYIRTAYIVSGKASYDLTDMNVVLSSLRPSSVVLDFVNRIEKQLVAQTGQQIRGTVGVHIRMQANLDVDVPGIRSLGRADVRGATPRMDAVAALRHNCHFEHFVDFIRSRQLVEPLEYHTYIISSDSKEAHEGMTQELGSKAFVPQLPEHRECERGPRDQVCIQLALAEMLILSRTSAFIFSTKSSFSEVVALLGNFKSYRLGNGCVGGDDFLL